MPDDSKKTSTHSFALLVLIN
nr:hypothetical protein LRH_00352 [Lacticaseibacillus rhamnosus HN001]